MATEELYASATRLHKLAAEARAMRAHLGAIDRVVSLRFGHQVVLPPSVGRAELDIDQAVIVMLEIEGVASALDWTLGTVADGYGFVEHFVQKLVGQFAGDLLGLVVRGVPAAVMSIGGVAALGAAGGVAAGVVAGGGPPRGSGGIPEGSAWSRENNELITNPLTVSLIRHTVDAVGDATLGGIREVEPLLALAGISGVAVASAGAMRAGSTVGLLTETPVRLTDSRPLPREPAPSGFAERLSRVPSPTAFDGAQVVVERYSTAHGPDRFEVYVAGTVTFSPTADTEPWDMTSNMANAVGSGSGSYDSVALAMREAGVTAESPVQLTGYSQGGGTVAQLAASGEFNVQGLASFGGPTGGVKLPDGVPALIVEHTDDPVPALTGHQQNLDAVIVERQVFGGEVIPENYAVPAHHREYYESTAQLMDDGRSEQLRQTSATLDGFTSGATLVSRTAYTFERADLVSATSSDR